RISIVSDRNSWTRHSASSGTAPWYGASCPFRASVRPAMPSPSPTIICTSISATSRSCPAAPRNGTMKPPAKHLKGDHTDALRHAAVGLEAEFTLVVDGQPTRPEDIFRDPRGFIGVPLMHRVGTSYHLPNSAAVY